MNHPGHRDEPPADPLEEAPPPPPPEAPASPEIAPEPLGPAEPVETPRGDE